MAGKRFRAEQIIMKLREAEVGLARGKSARQVCKPESVHQMQKGITCLTPQNSLWPLSGLLTLEQRTCPRLSPPSERAIIAAPQESLNTLTTVRHMSSGRSIASIAPTINSTCGPVKLTASKTIKMTTKPAEGPPAAAMDASNNVITIC